MLEDGVMFGAQRLLGAALNIPRAWHDSKLVRENATRMWIPLSRYGSVEWPRDSFQQEDVCQSLSKCSGAFETGSVR
jgi:hypothetical protein